MSKYTLHLDTAWLLAHGVTTLGCVNKELNAFLYGCFTPFYWGEGGRE